ncbi:hypothetical protein GLOIN_2v1693709 [Rhizophagus irregularis DAOM 181602=DAOM 197198]|uniref:Uncharacterized protein n=1 Tax=Rhizophagus irregularis (strain DAOM 181602 / DAOM 197198 / MUCL 43194) TaxID=747089 RepID=A0A2P4PBI3_RHIID|nr:hypothetical protein GLOIN_2v1693709 [Rhizophagus irregularis DAOM 181602=DAOM 197198]POG62749.1 hypothetical protein GLOIN_2v1693709 [Rhizophagus irregularis DAOM 181602=DAOM 197198]GET49748.1 hypothetical protein GLOIN_2v1693709 [Rhizophagus irregularis DAOM 181602=DAOM 197198]|eukprot:XP_025169615.1 hypothetical protein GLOIN_2v1693709 [Rhizophagus irregularis DAOM 181602=DAOM 197198]
MDPKIFSDSIPVANFSIQANVSRRLYFPLFCGVGTVGINFTDIPLLLQDESSRLSKLLFSEIFLLFAFINFSIISI